MLTRNGLTVHFVLVCLFAMLTALPGMGQVPPTASANFTPSTVVAGGSRTSTYTLTITNPNSAAQPLTNVQFTSTYPAGLVPDLIGNYTCATTYLLHPAGNPGGTNGGSGSFTAGGFSFTLNTLEGGTSCTVVFLLHASPVLTTTLITETTSTVTSNEASAGAAASATLTVNPQVATSFSVSAQAIVTVFQQDSITITCLDQSGNTFTGYSGMVNLTSSEDPNLIYSSGNPVMLTNGTGTFNVSPKTTGTWTVTATDSVTASITGTSNVFTANPGPTTRFIVSAATPETAGTSFNFTVTAVDLNNNTTPAYASTVSFSTSDPSGALPGSSTLTNGTKTFSANLHSPGARTITATDVPNSLTGTSGNIQVNAAPSPTLAEAFGAGSITVNNNTSLSFTVTNPNSSTAVQSIGFSDNLPAGLVVTTPNGQAGTCLTTGGGVIAGTPGAAAGGSAISLTSLSLAASASCAFSVNVTGTTTGAKVNTTGAITSLEGGTGSTATASLTVNPAQASQTITFGALPGHTYGDMPFTIGATATSGLAVTFASTTGGVCTVSGTTVTVAAAGSCSITASQAGNASYTAAPDVPQTFAVSKATLTVTANNANRLAGAANPIFSATLSGFVNGDTSAVVTGAAGLATVATPASPGGGYQITVAAGTLSAANYTFVFVNGTLTVTAAAPPPSAGSLTGIAGTPQVTIVNTAFATALQVTVLDQAGNPLPNATVTFSAPTAGAGLSAAGATVTANAGGVASFSAKANTVAGSYIVFALSGGASAAFNLTNNPGPVETLAATAGTPQSANVGFQFNSPLQASTLDVFGNGVPGISVTFAVVQTSNAGATFLTGNSVVTNAAGQANLAVRANGAGGVYTVTAASGVLTPVSFALTNVSAATVFAPALMSGSANHLGIAWANPTANSITITLTAYGYDGPMITGAGIQNPAQLAVPAHGQIAKAATEIFGPAILGHSGWVALQPSDPNAGGGFFLLYDSALQTVDGGPFVVTPAPAIVFPHVTNAAILHVVNTGFTTSGAVSLRVYDNNGAALGAATFVLGIHSGWSGRLADLLPSLGTVNGYAVIDSRNPFGPPLFLAGIVSYQQGGDSAVVTAQDDSAPIQTGYAVDIATGGGYSSQLRLINTGLAAQQLQLTLNGASVVRTIPPNGRLDEALGSMFSLASGTLTSGFLTVQALNGAGLIGFVEIASANGLALTAVPISRAAAAQTNMVFSQVAQGGSYFTGLAFANTGQTTAAVSIEIDSPGGSTIARTTVTISPGQQFIGLLSDFFPAIQNQFGGFIHIVSTQPIYGLEVFGSLGGNNSFLANVPPGTN